MHDHRSALWRWLRDHRHQLLLTTALVTATSALLVLGPLLIALAFAESMMQKRRGMFVGLILAAALARAVVWLWHELRDEPHGRWHRCAQCGQPIEEPSRAAYCSHPCRSYARLERDAQADDPSIADRARRRLRAIRLQTLADENAAWDEVPF